MTNTCTDEINPAWQGHKLLLRALACCVSAVLLWAAASLFLFVVPAPSVPLQADVLLVLAPPGDRIRYAEQLMDQGYAGTLAISVPLGEEDAVSALCKEQRTYRIVCFDPHPVTTQGEARKLRSLAKEHGWTSANVLTDRSHIPRAQLILERCFRGNLTMVSYLPDLPLLSVTDPRRSWAYRYAYEAAAFVKVAINQEC